MLPLLVLHTQIQMVYSNPCCDNTFWNSWHHSLDINKAAELHLKVTLGLEYSISDTCSWAKKNYK